MNKKIGLDVDDTIAAFFPHICKKYNQEIHTNIWDVKWISEIWHEIENDEDFWYTIPPLVKPEEIDFHIDCYISSMPLKMYEVRFEWLRVNGFQIAPLFVAPNHNKLEFVKGRQLDVFIDDRRSTCDLLREHGITAFKFVPYYMHDEPTSFDINSFKQVSKWILEQDTIKEN